MLADRRAPRFILVTDRRHSTLPVPRLAAVALTGGAGLVQIREKDLTDLAFRELTVATIEATGNPSMISVNGRPSIAKELGVGLHLPEAGLAPATARADLGPSALIGRSVHSPEAARTNDGADYLIAGHVFATASKPDRPPLGLDGLRRIVEASPIPVLAIGGISPANVRSVMAAGAYGIAVMSAVGAAEDPAAATRAIAQRLSTATENIMETTTTTVEVLINGKRVALNEGTTVQQFLRSKGIHDRLVVVELNEAILPRTAFESTVLAAGDRVEIVHFVGGG
jgi:thiamine biosynthesis protein ThiS